MFGFGVACSLSGFYEALEAFEGACKYRLCRKARHGNQSQVCTAFWASTRRGITVYRSISWGLFRDATFLFVCVRAWISFDKECFLVLKQITLYACKRYITLAGKKQKNTVYKLVSCVFLAPVVFVFCRLFGCFCFLSHKDALGERSDGRCPE